MGRGGAAGEDGPLRAQLLRPPGRDPALERLSPREREVARLFGSGLTHKAVARRLGSSPSTVRNQLARVYEKLGVSNKTELAALVGRDNR